MTTVQLQLRAASGLGGCVGSLRLPSSHRYPARSGGTPYSQAHVEPGRWPCNLEGKCTPPT